jgi:hypothetical protein
VIVDLLSLPGASLSVQPNSASSNSRSVGLDAAPAHLEAPIAVRGRGGNVPTDANAPATSGRFGYPVAH